MKTATITIAFEQDKLKALQFYAGKKEADLQCELDDFLQKLYEKYVPAQTREYIESQFEPAAKPPKRPNRPTAISPGTHIDSSRQNSGRTEP